MATIDPALKRVTIPQTDLTLVSGSLYELDTNTFRLAIGALLASEDYIWMDDMFRHNTEVSVAGTTFARTIEVINSWSLTFENISMAVRLAGSNNNFFDAESGVLINQPLVNVIGQNSAGLVRVDIPALDQAEIDSIVAGVFAQVLEGTETFAQAIRLIRAEAAGSIVRTGTLHQIKSANGLVNRITATADDTGRIVTDTDGT